MILEYIQNVRARLLEETQHWARKTERARAILEAVGDVIQAFEDMRFDLEYSTRFDQATDRFLDQWGELVDEKRGNLSDEDEYRRIILGRIVGNRSNAFVEDIIQITDTLFDPVVLGYVEFYPASYQVTITLDYDASDAFFRRASDVLRRSRPAGVGQSVVQTPDANILRLQDTEPSFDGPQFSRRIL